VGVSPCHCCGGWLVSCAPGPWEGVNPCVGWVAPNGETAVPGGGALVAPIPNPDDVVVRCAGAGGIGNPADPPMSVFVGSPMTRWGTDPVGKADGAGGGGGGGGAGGAAPR